MINIFGAAKTNQYHDISISAKEISDCVLDEKNNMKVYLINNIDKKDEDLLDKQKKLQEKEEKIDGLIKKETEKLEEISKLKKEVNIYFLILSKYTS